jgi:hypothetical protein
MFFIGDSLCQLPSQCARLATSENINHDREWRGDRK